MAEIIRETVTTEENSMEPERVRPVRNSSTQTFGYLVYFLFAVLEVLLVFRLFLKLSGASISSEFVGLVYGLTGIFILPFEGIFRRGFAEGVETTSVFEPSTVIAILVYAVVAMGIVRLIAILGRREE